MHGIDFSGVDPAYRRLGGKSFLQAGCSGIALLL